MVHNGVSQEDDWMIVISNSVFGNFGIEVIKFLNEIILQR